MAGRGARAPVPDDVPIADRIDDLPVPAEHDALFGHVEQVRALRKAFAGRRPHHAWLLGGPKGIGKATVAFRIATQLLADGDLERTRSHIAAHAHPGLLHLSRPWDERAKRFRTQLSVEEVRRTRTFFGMTAAGSQRRVCIVDAADDMNPSSANALLKILEEPPEGAVFFVISHAPGRLLPTIRSRCRTLNFQPLGEEDASAAVKALVRDAEAKDVSGAVAMAGGSVRMALRIMLGDVLDLVTRFDQVVTNAVTGRPSRAAAHDIADRATARGADFDTFMDLALDRVAARLRDPSTPDPTLVRWAHLWERVHESRERAATFNLDRKQVVLDLFALLFEFPEAKS